MSRYNKYFESHFRTLPLLVEGMDTHRGRVVKIHLLPGEFKVVGMSDGIDAWIAPTSVAPSPLFDKVRRVMHDIEQGKPLPSTVETPDVGVVRRRLPLTPVDDGPPPRRRLSTSVTGRTVDEDAVARQLLQNGQSQLLSLRRRNVVSA